MSDENSGTNPNVEVGAEETNTVDSGFGEHGALSFDDLEDTVEAETKSEDNEEITESEDIKSEEEVEDLKMVKALRGENPYEVPEDAIFTQKVNGVDTEISLRDLLNDYSGKTDWNKKYSELGNEKQAFKKSQIEFDTRVNTFVEKAKESKIDALAYLAETAGADPVAFIKEFKEGLIPDLQEYMNMSEVERQAYDTKQELDIIKKSNETKAKNEASIKEQAELEARVHSQIEELGVSQDDYVAAYDRMVNSGSIPQELHTPESVAQWIAMEGRVDLVNDALMNLDGELAEDVGLIEDLVRTSLQGGLDDEATLDVIKELYGKPSEEAKSASKKVKQANLKSVSKEITNQSKNYYDDSDVGPLSFDDI